MIYDLHANASISKWTRRAERPDASRCTQRVRIRPCIIGAPYHGMVASSYVAVRSPLLEIKKRTSGDPAGISVGETIREDQATWMRAPIMDHHSKINFRWDPQGSRVPPPRIPLIILASSRVTSVICCIVNCIVTSRFLAVVHAPRSSR